MSITNRYGRVNVKLVIILVLVVAALGVSLVAARQIRRSILSKVSLQAGEAAFEKGDWLASYKQFQEYLGRNPNDIEILKKYAKARLSVRPLDPANVAGAIAAYRRVLQLAPRDEVAYEQLALLYPGMGDFEDLAYIARMRLEHLQNDPNDRKSAKVWKASLWLADALVRLNKAQEARQTLEKLMAELEALPEKHAEYVKACVLMGQLAAGDSAGANGEVWKYLQQAVDYDPNSAEALTYRARFYRQVRDIPGVDENDRMRLAREDLERADRLGTDNPQLRYYLGLEWIAHKEFDRAAAELKAADALPQEALEKEFFDLDNWKVTRYLFGVELASRKGARAEAIALTREALASVTEKRLLARILPTAIPLVVADGNVPKAREYLAKYVEALAVQEGTKESKERLAYLGALVDRADSKWYAVIDVLQPALVGTAPDSELRRQLWRWLAEAYSRTDQSRRAIGAASTYLRNDPGQREMTLLLAREYVRLRDWDHALEAARVAESVNSADVMARLLRIEASIQVTAEQQGAPAEADFSKVQSELAQLRADHPDQVHIRILQAVIADYLKRPEQAEAELKSAIAECKEPLRAEMQLVAHHSQANHLDQAIGVCQAACERHAEVAEPWMSLANLYAAKNDHDAARGCLQKGLQAAADPDQKRTLSIQYALWEVSHGDQDAGIKLLSGLAAQDPQDIRVRILLLSLDNVLKDQARAQRLIDELRKAEGESGLWWRLHQAALWLSSGEWRSKQQEVTSLLRTCIDSDPQWSAPVLRLATMYENLNDLPRVEETCRQALARNPSATDVMVKLVSLLERQQRISDAEQVLRQADADTSVSSAWRIQTAVRAGDYSRAIEELKLRISNNARDANSRIALARLIYGQTKDAAQALKYVQEAEVIAPGSLAALAVKAAILRADGQTGEAQKILDDYVAKRQDFAAYQIRAAYFVGEGRWERAEEDYRKLTTFAAKDERARGYQLLSNFYISRKDPNRAIETLEEGLKADPNETSLERGLMGLLLRRAPGQGRERGIEMLAALEKRLPEDPELMRLRAMLLLDRPTSESLSQARAVLENVVKREPAAVDAHLTLVSLAMQGSDYRAAREYAIRGLGSNLGNRALLLAKARADLAFRDYSAAVDSVHQVLQADSNSIEAIDVLLEAGQRGNNRSLQDEARTRIDAAVRRAPRNEGLLLARARIMIALGQPKAAIPELESYCQAAPGSSSVTGLVTVADLYRLAGDADRSQQWIEQAQRLDAGHQAVVHARLLWLVSQSRWEELKGISAAYLSAKGQDATLLVRAASILTMLNSLELQKEGLKLFEQAVAQSPASIEARLGLASTLYRTGDVERAQRTYRDVLERYPDNIRALNDLAWILQEHDQRYDAALELADKGLKLASSEESRNLLDTRGTILMNLPNRLDDAKNEFAKLDSLLPDKTPEKGKNLLRLGRLCVQLNDPAQASQYLQKALEIDRQIKVFSETERAEIEGILQPKAK